MSMLAQANQKTQAVMRLLQWFLFK
jgi:flagellin-like hook-associated protein FlgL